MTAPRTEAGRSLLAHMTGDAAGFSTVTSGRFHIGWVLAALAKDIPLIEAEAAASVRAAVVERVGTLRTLQPGETPYGTLVWLVDVQAAIRLALLPTQASDSPEKP